VPTGTTCTSAAPDGGAGTPDAQVAPNPLCAQPVSDPVAVSDLASCQSHLRGRWAYCDGYLTGTPGNAPTFWAGSAGIELTDASGSWRFHLLYADPDGRLVSGTTPEQQGDVTVAFDTACEAHLSYDSGGDPVCEPPKFYTSPTGLSLDCFVGYGRFVLTQ
jgi:hypothetical protein